MSMQVDSALSLQIGNLSKSFSGQRVLHNFDFDLKRGEIHALVGENGCGKSTFIKCLSGFHSPDEGAEIIVHGQKMALPFTPVDALKAGFGFVHQNLGLIGDLTVLENLALSREFAKGPLWKIDWSEERRRASKALDLIGANIDPKAFVRDLSLAEQTLVAIARGLQISSRTNQVDPILVLDEPTAALPQDETKRLFEALNTVVKHGVSIIYVSHRLNEILQLADRVTAMRNGRLVQTRPKAGLTERELVEMIIGRSLAAHYPPISKLERLSGTVLETRNLCGRRIRDVNLHIRQDEIVGIAGLLGSGRSEIGRIIFGAQQRTSGDVAMKDGKVSFRSPADALAKGIGYVPQDRLRQGGFLRLPVSQNVTMANLSEFWRAGKLDHRRERSAVQKIIGSFDIRPNDPDARFGSLSGGNQQKAIIGRMLRLNPKLLILDEPVQGVDIGSKSEIYKIIENAAAKGMGVLLIDSDFEDLCRLCHRVLIVNQGRITAEASGASMTSDRISELVYLSEGMN
ncbi:sugar ABC transporter ATP-binding protein [Mesorhizobium cantuariense]|uniref:Sugar ABC transporter ATP-binding protein n=1 Tax=Mesorhizobium cantuariense TaxID=1300275 RepID=A0ABV7MRB5_9HYPH